VIQITLRRHKNLRHLAAFGEQATGTSVAQAVAAMLKTTIFGYGLLLVMAFVLGLVGTLAASSAVLRMRVAPGQVVELPIYAPVTPHAPPAQLTVEC
jgi:hypothetical protein